MRKRNRLLAIGAGAAIIGFALAGSTFSLSRPGVALAGDSTPATPAGCDATATPTEDIVGNISAFQAAPTDTPIATCTPTKVKTHTPTTVPTEPATETPPASTSTPVPPPATNTPLGTSGGVVVRPPDTGTGDSGAGSGNMLWVVIATALVAAGGGVMFVGARTKS